MEFNKLQSILPFIFRMTDMFVCTFSMHVFVLKCALLCTLTGGAGCACVLKNHTIWIERQDCAQCVAINTTICSGYCYTQVTFAFIDNLKSAI